MALTPEQKSFVDDHWNHILLIAIPGSGKTHALTAKAARLARAGKTVTTVTFTRQAKEELQRRIGGMLTPDELSRLQIGTFHGIIRRFMLNFDGSPIRGMEHVKDTVSRDLKEMALKHAGIEPTKRSLQLFDKVRSRVTDPYGIDAAKSLAPTDPTRLERLGSALKLKEAVRNYEERLHSHRYFDFDIMMHAALKLVLSGHRIFTGEYILVDEFQDVDELQALLVIRHKDYSILNAVGDDDQNMYTFRGGLGYSACQQFRNQTGAVTKVLSINFRCRPEILALGKSVIEENEHRVPKNLVPSRRSGARVHIVRCDTEIAESVLAADVAGWALAHGHKSVAIIARNNDPLIDIQPFMTGRVEFDRLQCKSFWDNGTCATLIALLRHLLAPQRETAALEVALWWAGATIHDVDTMRGQARGRPLTAVFGSFTRRGLESRASVVAVRWLRNLLGNFCFRSPPRSLADTGRAVNLVADAMLHHVRSNTIFTERHKAFAENVLSNAQAGLMRMRGSLSQRLACIERQESNPSNAPVKLMSMHASKGLEFDAVIIIQAHDNAIPGMASTDADIEEERRAMYVAITRARDLLVITYPHERIIAGRGRSLSISRFLLSNAAPLTERVSDLYWLRDRYRC